jgi:glycosyltransferase involved in cell wall biosynthesis
MVWSYLDLQGEVGDLGSVNYYRSPLGVDAAFVGGVDPVRRDIAVMTSGYVSHPAGEAIEEMALAADAVGLPVLHLGPAHVDGMRVPPPRWSSVLGISDCELATHYHRTEWVSGLRHVEGFELPVLEGLCCGARPIVFDRPDMTHWYGDYAAFVPECHGPELVEVLTDILRHVPVPVSAEERAEVARRFDWGVIARGFWAQLGV